MEYSFYENDGITPSKIADALQRIFLWTIPVIICVGTDAAIGDTLGPLVGTKLKEAKIPAYVYGNLGKTITAKEIGAIKTFIANVHPLAIVHFFPHFPKLFLIKKAGILNNKLPVFRKKS